MAEYRYIVTESLYCKANNIGVYLYIYLFLYLFIYLFIIFFYLFLYFLFNEINFAFKHIKPCIEILFI
jgi:hypothetical protein